MAPDLSTPHPRRRRLLVPARADIARRPLLTERLILEPLDTSQHKKFWESVDSSRASLEPWLPWVAFNDSPAASFRYAKACERDWDNGAAIRFSIRERNERPMIGVISLESCSPQHQSCDLGYWLHDAYRSQGFMHEACCRVLAFAFDFMGAHRVRCAAAEENTPSRKVIEKLGFLREGISRDAEYVHGRWVTHVVYSLLQTDKMIRES